MQKSCLWTKLRSRLQLISTTPGAPYNWVFLPGGPGLGSESLSGLTKILNKLPGSIWHLDLPGDGSNLTENNAKAFSHWSEALIEAVNALDKVILVAHSTGGMYALATPALRKSLIGLVLLNSAPDAAWQKDFGDYMQANPIQVVNKLFSQYTKRPSNALLKKISLASAPLSFTEKSLQKGITLLKTLPYNYESCEWSGQHFDSTYKAKWIPKKIPTLIIGGEIDQIISLDYFLRSKKFQRKNIAIRKIKKAGHFPWLDNPKEIIKIFNEFYYSL